MTIFTDGPSFRPQQGIGSLAVDQTEQIRAEAASTFADSPTVQLLGMRELGSALGSSYEFQDPLGNVPPNLTPQAPPPVIPGEDIPMEQARARVKDRGLEIKLPDQPTIKGPALDIMLQRAQDRREREATIARGPNGFVSGALSVGTSFLVGAIDPLNVASAFIPVMGEMRYAKLLADAGEAAGARAGVRAMVGGAQGAVGMAALQPLDYAAHSQDGRDFGMSDVLRNIMFGAALGGALHPIGGAISDRFRTAKERPLYPYDIGEPLEYHTPYSDLQAKPQAAPDILGEFPGVPAEEVKTAPQGQAAPSEPKPEPTPVAKGLNLVEAPEGGVYTPDQFKSGEKYFKAVDPNGNVTAEMLIKIDGDTARIEDILNPNAIREEGVGTIGNAQLRGLLNQFREKHPEVTKITGKRVSGARAGGEYSLLGEPTEISVALGPKPEPTPIVAALNDLPPRAKEDAMRVAVAALHAGEPVQVGEMLEAAAKDDPRIAESLDIARVPSDSSLTRTASWVIRNKETKEVIMETFDRAKVNALNTDKYEAVPIGEYLGSINGKNVKDEIKAHGETADPLLVDRAAEIAKKGGEADVHTAYERAILEDAQKYEATANARQAHPEIPNDPSAAPGDGLGGAVNGRQEGRPVEGARQADGSQPRSNGAADREADFKNLSQSKPEFAEPNVIEMSRAAEKLPDPAKASTDERLSAAEKAEAYAKQMFDMFAARLPEEERARLQDKLNELSQGQKDREDAVKLGASCMYGKG